MFMYIHASLFVCVCMIDGLRHTKRAFFVQFVNLLEDITISIQVEPALTVMPAWAKTVDLNPALNFMDVLPYVKFEQGRFRVPNTAFACLCQHTRPHT